MYYLFDLCCICVQNKKDMSAIDECGLGHITYYTKLTSIVPELKQEEVNNFKYICDECRTFLEKVYEFRKKCLRNMVVFESYVTLLQSYSNTCGEISVVVDDIKNSDDYIEEDGWDNIEDSSDTNYQDASQSCEVNEGENNGDQENKAEESTFEACFIKSEVVLDNIKSEVETSEEDEEDDPYFFDGIKTVNERNGYLNHSFIRMKNSPGSFYEKSFNPDGIAGTSSTDINTVMEKLACGPGEDLENEFGCDIYNKKCTEMSSFNVRKSDKEKPYIVIRNKRFKWTHSLDVHRCHICNKKFSHVSFLKVHLRKHVRRRANKCLSDREFNKLSNLKKHTLINAEQGPHKCEICGKEFTYLRGLKQHMPVHNEEKQYMCEICNKRFTRKDHLNIHLRNKHTHEKSHECHVCQKRFSEASYLKTHLLIHNDEKPHKCEVCDKRFIRTGDLTKHIRSHTGEKPFKCELCEKRFSQSGDLNKHMFVHTGDKPYKCKICDKSFTRKYHLDQHVSCTHIGEKPHQCEVCNKKYARSIDLKNHKRSHTGEKPYKCGLCDKRFVQATCLRQHMLVHSDKKPHQCEVCGRGFIRRIHLKAHMYKHTGEKPHKCNVCNKRFTGERYFKFHMQKHNEEKSDISELEKVFIKPEDSQDT